MKVIAEFVDSRSGKRYWPGDIIDPPLDADHAERLKRALCVVDDGVSAPAKPVAAASVADLRARLEGESDRKYNTRMAKLAAEEADAADKAAKNKTFVDDFFAMEEADERDEMYATFNDEEKALVDSDPRKTALTPGQ